MEIKHDFEYHEKMIKDLKDVQDFIENFNGKIHEIGIRMNKMYLEGSDIVLKNAIDELEDKLIYTFAPTLEDFIDTMENSSSLIEEEDRYIARSLKK